MNNLFMKIANKFNDYYPRRKKLNRNIADKKSIYTIIPNKESIELISYYDEFINYYPNCELDTKQWFVSNIGNDWVIFDCGANIGYFSILFAKLAPHGHVYAFEPTDTYEMLLKNINHHKLQNISVINMALGNKSGSIEENIYRIWGNDPERKEYLFTTIDNFIQENNLKKLDCVKIDVDSFDFEVLQGARGTLLKYNPYVLVELNHALNERQQTNMQALDWLAGLGYRQALVLDDNNFLLKRDIDIEQFSSGRNKINLYFQS